MIDATVTVAEETLEGKDFLPVYLWYYVTGDIAEDTERKFQALEEYRKTSGHDVDPENVDWIAVQLVQSPRGK